MKSAIRNVVTLTLITLVAGLCLGFVYEITKQPIADMEEKTKQTAYKTVFPSAATFESYGGVDEDSQEEVLAKAGVEGVDIEDALYAIDESGNQIGYVIMSASHEGYGGDIQISVGIDNSGCVTGVEILSISETAGLGMKAKDDNFKNQFKGKTVDEFMYTKTGATQDFEIDALSGATITTKAFTNAVNGALAFFRYIGGGLDA